MINNLLIKITAEEENVCQGPSEWIAYVNTRILRELIELGFIAMGATVFPFDVQVRIFPNVKENFYLVQVDFEAEREVAQ